MHRMSDRAPGSRPVHRPSPGTGSRASVFLASGFLAAGLLAAAEAAPGPAPLPPVKPAMIATSPAGVSPPKALSPTDQSCFARLTALGAVFRPLPPIATAKGCRIDVPVSLSRVGDTTLSPPATLACETALRFAEVSRDIFAPLVQDLKSRSIATIHVAASYACRGRNRRPGAKLSEHAFGRAIDVRALTLDDGTNWAVEPRSRLNPRWTARLQRRLRAGVCGPFTTVLGPGSDKYHDDHIHMDLAPRRSTYCR